MKVYWAAGAVFFVGVGADDLVENRPGAAALAEHSAQSLLGLAAGGRAADHHGHLHLGQVHALVEHLVGHQRQVAPLGQPAEHLPTLLLAAVVQ